MGRWIPYPFAIWEAQQTLVAIIIIVFVIIIRHDLFPQRGMRGTVRASRRRTFRLGLRRWERQAVARVFVIHLLP